MNRVDREKVIKGLENLSEWLFQQYRVVYDGDAPDYYDAYKTVDDALVLLKEQEAVEPILIREGRNKHYNDYVCPRCDNEVVYEQNYCSECGVKFMWEGR